MTSRYSPEERLLRGFAVDEKGCWVWQGSRWRGGYGTIKRDGRVVAAHRFSWELANGPIASDLTVDHLCFNPPCINPGHLRLLSLAENSRNQRKAFKTHCAHGHEFTPENTCLQNRPNGRTWRSCGACRRLRKKAAA